MYTNKSDKSNIWHQQVHRTGHQTNQELQIDKLWNKLQTQIETRYMYFGKLLQIDKRPYIPSFMQ